MPEEKVSADTRTTYGATCTCDQLGRVPCPLHSAPAADAGPRQHDPTIEWADIAFRQWQRDTGKPASASERNAFIDGFQAAAKALPVPQEAAPKQWKRGASGHYAEHLSTHTNPPEECSTCKVIEAQMTVNNLPQGAVGVPQEAAPIFNTHESLTVPIGATAPDWAMRVAADACQRLWHELTPNHPASVREIAEVIRQAGSERERELRGALKDALADYFESHLGARLDAETDDEWKPDWYIRASRLLGGESK